MRYKRQKKMNKMMNFYCNNYGFRKPFQLLVDGTFCQAALKSKLNIKEQLPSYFQGEVKLLTTQCVILETEELGPAVYGAMLIVKQFPVHRCGHEMKPVSGSKCLESMIGTDNPNRYILATQDRELQAVSERVPGVPIMFLYQKAPTLQDLTHLTIKVAQRRQKQQFKLSDGEKKALRMIRREKLGPQLQPKEQHIARKKKKKKGGPNPLSCKKKKVKTPQQQNQKKNKS